MINIDIALVIIILIVAVVGGLIIAGLMTLFNIWKAEKSSKRDWEKGNKVMELKGQTKSMVIDKTSLVKENIEVPKPVEKIDYKDDFKKFTQANKELIRLTKEYEEGNLTHPELKEKFDYYQNQDYYKRVLKSREDGKK